MRIKVDLPKLKRLFLQGNNFEQDITGHQTIVMQVFGDSLEELDGVPLDDIDITNLRPATLERREGRAEGPMDDDESSQEENEMRRGRGTYLSKMTEDVEKSLRTPSQANNNLTELKRKAQLLTQAKGNVFSDDISVIVTLLASFSITILRTLLRR